MKEIKDGVAIAAVSLAVVETLRVYREAAPSLADIRRADPGDYTTTQLVLDADMLGAIMVLAIGGGATLLTGRWYPLVLASASLAMVSFYYRSVLRSTNEGIRRK